MLIALLDAKGLSLDAVVQEMEPQVGWVRQTCQSSANTSSCSSPRIVIEFKKHSTRFSTDRLSSRNRRPRRRVDEWLMIEAHGHSLEFYASLGGLYFHSRFGRAMIEVPDSIPLSVLQGATGRYVEELIDLDFCKGRGWPIIGIESRTVFQSEHAVVVATGSVEYRMPWARSNTAACGPDGAGAVS